MARRLSVYADSTVLIGLGRIDRLDLLTVLPLPIYVTQRVWEEVASDLARPGVAALQRSLAEGLLEVVDEGDPDAFAGLDPGESTVLTAAASARAAVLIDERRAREMIDANFQLRDSILGVIGTVGLMLLAKRQGYVPAIRPLLHDLIQQGFWVSPSLFRHVLEEAGEA